MESVLLDAKREYTGQVVSKITRPLYDEIYGIWKNSLQNDEDRSVSPMRRFQDALEVLATLPEKEMLAITDRCVENTRCEYIADLITAVFVAHTRVLLLIKDGKPEEGYRLQVPSPNRFMKACLLRCARAFWKSPYLYYQNEANNKITKVQIQKNLREAEKVIEDAVRQTIRDLLPLKDVLDAVIIRGDDGNIIVEMTDEMNGSSAREEDVSGETVEHQDTTRDDSSREDVSGEGVNHDDVSGDRGFTNESPTDSSDNTFPNKSDEVDSVDSSSGENVLDSVLQEIRDGSQGTELPKSYEESDLSNPRTVHTEHEEEEENKEHKNEEEQIHHEEKINNKGVSYVPGTSVDEWDSIEIRGPPERDVLLEAISDAISLDDAPPRETTPVTIDAEEL